MQKLRENLQNVQKKIIQAALRANRDPSEISLVAVTKTVPSSFIEKLMELGVKNIGENRVQDARMKKDELAGHDVSWHLIGHLQRNKVKTALETFDFFHSVDTVALAKELSEKSSKSIPVLLEVNVSGEESKQGFAPEILEKSIENILSFPNLCVQGFMTMAPLTENQDVCRDCFRKLRELKDYFHFKHLSMGMSQDYEIAIEEGATMVRVGSALFEGCSIL
ncbi:MAG: YggS family pyridoxal phosphate-dependent enzyme [Candidatus Brocadiae bacterium]|nr:YggS family pyridoxal phosphate-dependent enzyme [Candidatus Brocadiia bacterium]